MKKKILFMIINMNIGGTEKSLLNMLSEMNKEKYDVTVLMLEQYGDFLKDMPGWVNVKYLDGYDYIQEIINNPLHITAIKYFKSGKIINSIKILQLYFKSKLTKERSCLFRYILKNYPSIDENYDIAVAYAGPMDFISYFVANKIKSKKKIQWIHFDVTKIGFNKHFARTVYPNFDKIFVVSKESKSILEKLLPELKDRIQLFYNILSSNYMIDMANKDKSFDDDFKGIRILTVGRLTKQKGQDLAANILYRLKSDGYNVRWYFIGEGSMRRECEELAELYNIKEEYILLGASKNPYPFIKDCHLYVQPSRHEGYCITLAEARCFDAPIVSTCFAGAREQIVDGYTGLLVDIDEYKIYKGIKKLLDNKKLYKFIKANLKGEKIDNKSEIEKLYKLIEE